MLPVTLSHTAVSRLLKTDFLTMGERSASPQDLNLPSSHSWEAHATMGHASGQNRAGTVRKNDLWILVTSHLSRCETCAQVRTWLPSTLPTSPQRSRRQTGGTQASGGFLNWAGRAMGQMWAPPSVAQTVCRNKGDRTSWAREPDPFKLTKQKWFLGFFGCLLFFVFLMIRI